MTTAERRAPKLAAAFTLACGLHIGFVAVLRSWRGEPPPRPPGEQRIAVDLAPAASNASTVAAAETAPAVETNAEAAPPIEAPSATRTAPSDMAAPVLPDSANPPIPIEAAVNVPPPAIVISTNLDAVRVAAAPPVEVPSDPAPVVVASPAPLPTVAPPPPVQPPPMLSQLRPAESQRPEPPRRPIQRARVHSEKARPRTPPAEAPSTSRPSQASAPSVARGAATASRLDQAGSAAMADSTDLNRYAAALAAALRARLHYPDWARSQGVTGITVLRFTLDRGGAILASSVDRSAGLALLDQAAIATVHVGTALPPPPPSLARDRLTIAVPLRFDLR